MRSSDPVFCSPSNPLDQNLCTLCEIQYQKTFPEHFSRGELAACVWEGGRGNGGYNYLWYTLSLSLLIYDVRGEGERERGQLFMAVVFETERWRWSSYAQRTYTKPAEIILSLKIDILSNSFLLCTCARRPKLSSLEVCGRGPLPTSLPETMLYKRAYCSPASSAVGKSMARYRRMSAE